MPRRRTSPTTFTLEALFWYWVLKSEALKRTSNSIATPASVKPSRNLRIVPAVDKPKYGRLKKNEKVRVEGMAPEEECEKEMFVKVTWRGRKLAVPLSQLEGVEVDDETREAVEDWHYWVSRGHRF